MKTRSTFFAFLLPYLLFLKKWPRLAFFLVLGLSFSSLTQAQNIELDKTFGSNDYDRFSTLQQTQDGGYILSGQSDAGVSGDKTEGSKDSYYGAGDYWLIKVDANGKKMWDKTLGGIMDDYPSSIQQTKDGGYIVGGSSSSSISGDKSENNIKYDDFWIVKLNAAGQKEWDKTLGWKGFDNLTVIQQTPDGGYIVGGSSNSNKGGYKSENSRGYSDYWVIKLDATGKKQWDKTLGGDQDDGLASIQQTQDGGYILGGTSYSNRSGDKSENKKGTNPHGDPNTDYWVVKIDAQGTKEWDKTLGGNDRDDLISVQQTPDGGYILGGSSQSPKGYDKSENHKTSDYWPTFDYWLVKLDASGKKVWDKTLGGNSYDLLFSLQLTSEGTFILGGSSESTKSGDKSEEPRGFWMIGVDALGNKIWDKTLAGKNFYKMQIARDGSFILGGDSERQGTSYDYHLVKLKLDQQIQAITFAPISDKPYNAEPFALRAKASSGLPVTFNLIAGPATLKDSMLTITGEGTVTVKATQAGNAAFLAAPEIVRSFKVIDNRKTQTITFQPIPSKTIYDKPFALTAAASSGLPLSYRVVSGAATIQGNKVTLTNNRSGTVTIEASQPGNDGYKAALAVTQTFGVATPFTKTWDRTIGGNNSDGLSAMIPTADGGYLLGGTSPSGKSGEKSQSTKGGVDEYGNALPDYWIVKVDAAGNKEWDQTYGGNKEDALASLVQTSDGGYLLGGISLSDKSGDKSENNRGGDANGSGDYWIIKVDASGKKMWDKTIGGSSRDELKTVRQTRDGGYILGGTSYSGISGDKSKANEGWNDYWIVKLDAAGNKQREQTFGTSFLEVDNYLIRGNSDFVTLEPTQDGGYILGGYSTAQDAEFTKIWIIKVDATGNTQWSRRLGGGQSDVPDYLNTLQQTQDGGYIVGASTPFYENNAGNDKSEDSKGEDDYWVIKLDSKGNREWDRTIGGSKDDLITALQQTPDGGYILGGSSWSGISADKSENNKGGSDFWIVKLNSTGEKIWDKTIGGTGVEGLAYVQQTSDGGYIMGGSSSSEVNGDKSEPSRGFQDYWIIKIQEDQPVATAWNMRYGGSGTDNLTSTIKTLDGGYLSGGYTNSSVSGDKSQSSQGKNDYWIVKSDKNGKKLWDKRFGGSEEDYLNRVIQTQDGGYLLLGSSFSGKSGNKSEANKGNRDFWILKVDAQGNKQWDKTLGGSGTDELEKAIQLSSGEYVLGGHSNSPVSGDKTQASQGSADYWLVKISKTGTIIWDQRYGGNQAETLGSFIQTPDGGFLLGGSSKSDKTGDKTQPCKGDSDYWVVKTDKQGKLVWEKTLGGSGTDEAYSIGLSSTKNYFIAGTSISGKSGDKSQASQGGKDYWLVTLDQNGTKLWDRTFGGGKDDEFSASTINSQGHYLLAGHSYSDVSGDKTQSSQGESDYWVVEVDEKGSKIQDQRYGGSGKEELRTVTTTKDGGLLLAGRSNSGASGDRTQPSQGSTDYWLVKVAPENNPTIAARQASLVQEPVAELTTLMAYPNPFQEKVTISFTLPATQAATVRVLDGQGRELKTLFQGEAKANQKYEVEWRTGKQESGLYLLQLQTPTYKNTQKLLLTK